jgi:predicted Zn-dependent protease
VDCNVETIANGLSKQALCREIDKSFKSWEPAGVFSFTQAAEGEKADITISFEPPPGRFWDGQLGTMGHAAFPWAANRGRIYLDPSEWWSAGAYSLLGDRITEWLPHEIGHVLGLQHTHKPGDMMCATGPYDLPDVESFSRLRHLYAPATPVIAWSSFSTAASTKPRMKDGYHRSNSSE